ncbi:hypothetical protein BGZ54_003999, partial [Gamsiella multidivaricata]
CLPEYMMPAAFVRLDTLPITNNGKVDRRALPEPDNDALVTQDYEAPLGETETAVAGIWSELLKVGRIGRHDNFFMLGGHSLLVVQMIEQLRRIGLTASVRVLFETPTLAALCQSLTKHRALVAPPNLIKPDTTRITPELLPLIDLTQDEIDAVVEQIPGGVANVQDIYALSPLQDGMLFHHMLATKGDTYLITVCMAFENKDLLVRYMDAVQKVVNRHDILRTAIVWKSVSTPAQVILRQAPLSVTEIFLDPANGSIAKQMLRYVDPREHHIDLTQAPLTRFVIAQDADGRWIVAQLLHHLIGDHSTLEEMHTEIYAFLAGRGGALPSPQPFRNLITQVRFGLGVEAHERFFTEMLNDIDTPTLPYGLSNVHRDGLHVSSRHCELPQGLNDSLRAHSKRLGVSLASLCHLAWAQVLANLSGQHRVVFGTVLFGRMQGGSGSDRAMGLFINTLPFRVDVEDSSVLESVRKTQNGLAALLEHEHASLALAQRCSSVPSGVPLFSTILNYRHHSTLLEDGVTISGIEFLEAQERTNYPFTLSVEDGGTTLGLTAQVVQPFDPAHICSYMRQALLSLSNALDRTPDIPVQRLDVLPIEERELTVRSWNATARSFPDHVCVQELFESQAQQSPEAIALVFDGKTLTYRELNARANSLARQLVELGAKPGDFIATMLRRSFELIAAQLAILKIGAAYVPIDPKAPLERQIFIATDSAARVLITHVDTNIPTILRTPLLRLSVDDTTESDGWSASNLNWVFSSFDTAYVMYTSGSTGLPKGVLVPHRGISRLVVNSGYVDIGPEDRVAFAANPAFDASTFELWSPLLNGGCSVIIDADTFTDPQRLAEALDRHQVTAMWLTMALFNQYVLTIGSELSKLR